MRKRLLTLVLLAGTLICAPAAARAETLTSERNISFTSDNKLSEDRSAADMNSAVYELQPGDDITITLNLKNDNASAANWYMTNEVLQSLEETAGSGASGGAYEYELTYTDPAGAREVLFTSDTVGGENSSSRVGLKAATSGLEDFLYLDTLSPGQRGVVTLRVALDGETQGNDYQNTLASLQMNFAVDTTTVNNQTVTRVVDENGNPILVDDNGNPVADDDGGNGSHARTGIVRTGDENDLLPYVAAAGVSGLLLLILAIIGIKERKKAEKGMKAMALCLALSLAWGMSVPAQAAEDYTYTLRLYAGAQGTIDASVVQRLSDAGATVSIEDGEVCVVSGLHYGEQVVFDIQRGVALQEGSKYYRKGFRVSGEDTNRHTGRDGGLYRHLPGHRGERAVPQRGILWERRRHACGGVPVHRGLAAPGLQPGQDFGGGCLPERVRFHLYADTHSGHHRHGGSSGAACRAPGACGTGA